MIDTGIVPKIVEILGVASIPRLQYEAAWCLTNIASGTSQQTQAVVQAGAVVPFINLLSVATDEVREQAVWALGNIAGDSPTMRDYVLGCGVMPPLLALLATATRPSLMRNATWALSNFCRGKPGPAFEVVRPALTTISHLLYHHDVDVLTDACWALSYLSDGGNERIVALLESGITRRVVELLAHPHTAVQSPALRTIGNIVTGDDNQTQTVINVGAVPALLGLLASHKKSIRKEACWTASNLTAGTKKQIQSVLDAGLIPELLSLMEHGEFEVKKEASWAISNACSGGSSDQVRYLVSAGCIPPLCSLLTSSDARIVSVALEGIDNILRVGDRDAQDDVNAYAEEVEEADGLSKIELLQAHQNSDVYDRATKILEKYFQAEACDPSVIPQMQTAPPAAAPGAPASFYTFGLPPSTSSQRFF